MSNQKQLTLSGRLHKVFDQQQVTDSFIKREFVIETDELYPQLVNFELTQDKCDIVSQYKEGDKIQVFFNVRGREWNEKFFTNLNAWRISMGQYSASNAPSNDDIQRKEIGDFIKAQPVVDATTYTPDDLPF